MKNTTPYLHFDGQAEEAMTFYKTVFGGDFAIAQRYKDTPGGEKVSPGDKEKFIHITLRINDQMALMATDLLSTMGTVRVGNNVHICVHTDSEQETEKVFDKLSKGGQVFMPLNKTFWGAYFGMCADQFGVQWMIEYSQMPS